MDAVPAGGRAFWSCAGFTLFSALVSCTFSVLALRMNGGSGHQHEYALYAASRSVALVLATFFAMGRRSWGGVAAMAVAMTLMQFFDAGVGFLIKNPGEIYGPLIIAVVNAALLVWMGRSFRRAFQV